MKKKQSNPNHITTDFEYRIQLQEKVEAARLPAWTREELERELASFVNDRTIPLPEASA